jgi:alpha-2-macroglobulin
VGDADLASVSIEPNLWPTSAVIDWLDLLKRAPDLSRHEEQMSEAEQILRSRLNFQGTTMGFSTERTDYLWWLMVSGDVNANRMLLSMLDRDAWREDVPRLVRGSLGRQQRGHWNTTVANAWGVLALEGFGAKFESEPVTGVTAAELAKQDRTLDWSQQPEGGSLLFAWPVGEATLALAQQGTGKPWAMVQSLAAIPLTEPFSSGYRIARTVSAVEQKKQGQWSRGDVMRVRLELEAQSDMSWVVVNDPVPAGAAILGTGLGRDSQILASGEKKQGWVWPAFEERKFDSFRAYYGFVPKGKWTLEYTLRLNNAGEFLLPETRVEALYAPEMFGEAPNAKVSVAP